MEQTNKQIQTKLYIYYSNGWVYEMVAGVCSVVYSQEGLNNLLECLNKRVGLCGGGL